MPVASTRAGTAADGAGKWRPGTKPALPCSRHSPGRVYADAYEWVEAPNTIGMSQFADGGTLASKPYAASGAYIDRTSDYCGACAYDVKQKAAPKACP